MSAHTADEVRKHLRAYVLVFMALMAGTLITVWIWSLHLPMSTAITLQISLAVLKASLVLGYFMHLLTERKTTYAILVTTAFFFAFLMYLTIWSTDQHPVGTWFIDRPPAHSSGPVTPGK
jgi:cytochrome c oxidase subunit 4